jgi:predicted NBD/HSP70 family sugar kinase
MNITPTSTKADIIDASMEIIETQSEQITALQERQLVLLALVGVLSVLLLLGA